jgi:hypothetical protein
VRVAVGTDVLVAMGDTGVVVDVLVGGTGVFVGVLVGGTGVFVGVLVGGTGVGVGMGVNVAVGTGVLARADLGVGVAVAVGRGRVDRLMTRCGSRQAGPPTGSVTTAFRAPARRSTRRAPAGALGNRVLNRTVMVNGQTGLRRRSTVMAPVCASTRTRRGGVIMMRAMCRAAQHPDRCKAIMCCAARSVSRRTVHTKVVAAAGGRGDRRTATRSCGAAGAAWAPGSPPASGDSTSVASSSAPGTAQPRGRPPGRVAGRWEPRARLTHTTPATRTRRRHGERQGQRLILFWTRPWRTCPLLASGPMIACRVTMHRGPGMKMLH